MLFQILNKLYSRFISPSPVAFKIVNWICNICLGIGAIQELFELFQFTLPYPYDILTYKTFMVSAGIVRLLSGMTVLKTQTNEKE